MASKQRHFTPFSQKANSQPTGTEKNNVIDDAHLS